MGKISNTNYALPGKPMNKIEFKRMIAEAENGKFYSVDALRTEVDKWKIKRSK